MSAPRQLLIDGSVSRAFEPVREAFIENFTQRGELGGACCIYQDGEKVVDLWGGVRDRASGEPWREDTMVLVHSTHQGHGGDGHGARPLRAAGSTTTSASARTGPSSRRPARSASRSASCSLIRPGCSRSTRRSTARSSRISIAWRAIMARQRPVVGAGRAAGLSRDQPRLLRGRAASAASIRGIAPSARFFDEEIAEPLGVDFYIGVPESIPDDRARAARATESLGSGSTGLPLKLDAGRDESALGPSPFAGRQPRHATSTSIVIGRSLRNLEVPSGGGVGHRARDRQGVRRVRHRRPGARPAARDDRRADRASDSRAPWLLRRVLRWPGEVLARVHEAHRVDSASVMPAPSERRARVARWATRTPRSASATAT